MNKEFIIIIMGDQRKWFLQMKYTSDKDVVYTVEITRKDLGYYIKLDNKFVEEFQRI